MPPAASKPTFRLFLRDSDSAREIHHTPLLAVPKLQVKVHSLFKCSGGEDCTTVQHPNQRAQSKATVDTFGPRDSRTHARKCEGETLLEQTPQKL